MSALDVAREALAAAGGDAEAVAHVERSGLARFAGSEVHQPTLIENIGVTLRVIRDSRSGVATTNKVEEEGLAQLARRATDAAESAPADETFPGLAPPAETPRVEGDDEETARLGPGDQARLAAAAIDAAGDVPVFGFFTSAATELAVASSTGVSVEQPMTDATALVVAADEGRSGYAEQTAWRARDVDPAAVGRDAAAKAEQTAGSVADDSLDPRGLPKAFDFEGTPKQRVQFVEDGVARGVVWDRTTAAQASNGAESTGHAPPIQSRDWGPLPYALSVAPGEAESVEELAELVADGIYITRLHYLGVVHPREGVITGMTRDGTFRIRAGKIAEPLVNLRFTVAVPELLREVYGLTKDVALVNSQTFYGERYPYGVLAPALASARFTVTGVGSKPGI